MLETDKLEDTKLLRKIDHARVATMTDAVGRRHRYTYTPRGLMTAEYQNDQLWMTYAYDILGNCTSTTNAQNVPTTRGFDGHGWCVAETTMLVASTQGGHPVFRTTSWTYDAAGEVLTQINRFDPLPLDTAGLTRTIACTA